MLTPVRLVARSTLLAFAANRVEPKDREVVAEKLDAWYRQTLAARWQNSAELKAQFGTASIVSAERVVFNIKGNDYRLVAVVNYTHAKVNVIWLGTHREYDRIDVRKVEYDKSRYFGPGDRD
jgi:mRNA interferase HigB